jgi:hypothetical protein
VENVLEWQNHWREVNDRQGHARLHRSLLALKGWGKCTPNIA